MYKCTTFLFEDHIITFCFTAAGACKGFAKSIDWWLYYNKNPLTDPKKWEPHEIRKYKV